MSPAISRCPANNSPAPSPTNGIFLSSPFPSALPPTFASAFAPTLAPIFFAPFFSNDFPALLAPLSNPFPCLATLLKPFPAFLPITFSFLNAFPAFVFLRNFPALLNGLLLRNFLNLLLNFLKLGSLKPPPPLSEVDSFFFSSGAMAPPVAAPPPTPPHHCSSCFSPILNAGLTVFDIPNTDFNLFASAKTLPFAGDAGNVSKNPIDEPINNDAPSLYIDSIDLPYFDIGMTASASPPSPTSAIVRSFTIPPFFKLTSGSSSYGRLLSLATVFIASFTSSGCFSLSSSFFKSIGSRDPYDVSTSSLGIGARAGTTVLEPTIDFATPPKSDFIVSFR